MKFSTLIGIFAICAASGGIAFATESGALQDELPTLQQFDGLAGSDLMQGYAAFGTDKAATLPAPVRMAPFTRTNRHERPNGPEAEPLRVAPYTRTNRYELPRELEAEPIRVAPYTKTNLTGCALIAQDSVSLKPANGCV